MSENPRVRRVADRIQQVVAKVLDTKIKDPRLGFVTVTEVRVTGDLQQATVFYTVMGEEEDRAATAAALESAKGLIRSEVGQAVKTRLTPSITFMPDALPRSASNLNDALARAAHHDAQVAQLAQNAQFAGDADPYRADDDGEEDFN